MHVQGSTSTPNTCEALLVPAATTNLSPSTICQDTPCLIRFPAVGQKDRSKGKNAEVEGREGKNGRGSLDGKITSTQAAVALSAHHKKCGQIKASPHSCKIG